MNEDEQASMAVLRKVKEKATLQVAFNRRLILSFTRSELVRSGKINGPR